MSTKLKSPNGRQTLAVVTATLWMRCRIDPDHPISDADRIAAFERAIDATKLQRESATTIRVEPTFIELSGDVLYGPVYGGCYDDIDRSAESIENALWDVPRFNWSGSEIHNVERHALTLAELTERTAVLAARTRDAGLTDDARENARRRLDQCGVYLAQHEQPASLVDGVPGIRNPSKAAEPPHVVSTQEVVFGPQSVDANTLGETPKQTVTCAPHPDKIDLVSNVTSTTYEEIRHEEEHEENNVGKHEGRGDEADRTEGREHNDVFRSRRDDGDL
jgi:hypothetical protein